MIEFICHDGLLKEIAAFKRRFPKIDEGLEMFKRLCEVQFNPENPKQIIAPAKLHRVTQNDVWTMWKIELVIPGSGLRPNQFPRMWFAVKGAVIVFLCIGTHIENYKDIERDGIAFSRVTDIF